MAINIKAIAKAEPGVSGGGTSKFYAQTVISGTVDLPELAREIEKISTVHESDIMAVLTALVSIVPEKLADSKIVRLGEIGTLRPSISSVGHEKKKEVSANSVKKSKVLFRPGARIAKAMKVADYKKVS